jgi:hypothetical protein
VLAAIDAQHSAAIAAAAREGCCSAEPVESADAEAAVSKCRRLVNSIRQALEEVAGDQIRANSNLEAAKADFNRLALAVLVEQHHLALDKWAGLRDQYHTAEAAFRGLHQAIGQFGRDLEDKVPGSGIYVLQTLEKISAQPWHLDRGHVEMGPREVNAAASKWASMLVRLKTDPGATFD